MATNSCEKTKKTQRTDEEQTKNSIDREQRNGSSYLMVGREQSRKTHAHAKERGSRPKTIVESASPLLHTNILDTNSKPLMVISTSMTRKHRQQEGRVKKRTVGMIALREAQWNCLRRGNRANEFTNQMLWGKGMVRAEGEKECRQYRDNRIDKEKWIESITDKQKREF